MLEERKKIILLKVLVGSNAHGLADKNSDKDYRGVFVYQTKDILSLGFKYKATDWIEGEEDNTTWELGHFLMLATKCNPTILEVFKAPIIEVNDDGLVLRDLFPYVWNTEDTFNAFVGYGLNQRKKFLDDKDKRRDKYGVAYIRTLYALIDLFEDKDFSVEIKDPKVKELLSRYKKGNYSMGEVIDMAEKLTMIAYKLKETCNQKTFVPKIDEFLLQMREKYWEF